MGGTFGTPTAAVSATLDAAHLAGLASGNHTLYVRGQDAAGTGAPFNFGRPRTSTRPGRPPAA